MVAGCCTQAVFKACTARNGKKHLDMIQKLHERQNDLDDHLDDSLESTGTFKAAQAKGSGSGAINTMVKAFSHLHSQEQTRRGEGLNAMLRALGIAPPKFKNDKGEASLGLSVISICCLYLCMCHRFRTLNYGLCMSYDLCMCIGTRENAQLFNGKTCVQFQTNEGFGCAHCPECHRRFPALKATYGELPMDTPELEGCAVCYTRKRTTMTEKDGVMVKGVGGWG